MEIIVRNDVNSDIDIKGDDVSLPRDSKSVAQTFEINQNYLGQSDAEDIETNTSKSGNGITEIQPFKENGSSNKGESGESSCLEEKTKMDSKLVLQIRKKQSFMVSAILEGADQTIDSQTDEKQSESDTPSVNVSKQMQAEHIDNGTQSGKSFRQKESIPLQADKLSDKATISDSSSHIKSKCTDEKGDADSTIVETVAESYNADEAKDKVSVSSNFANTLDDFGQKQDKADQCQVGKFELKINEIKERTVGQCTQLDDTIQEKKVRKRKQERPKSILYNLGGHEYENETVIEDNSQVERKSKRKQNITKRYYRYDQEPEESGEIKQTPLCSKLFASDSKRLSTFSRRNLVDSEENSQSEDSNIPCTTNRYRRHFLKQLRSAEASKIKTQTEPVPIVNKHSEKEIIKQTLNVDQNEEYDSDDDYFFDGKRIKMSEIEENLDSNNCKVCNKEFNDIGTLMAHFICHSALEKEQADFMQFRQDNNPSSSLELSTYICHLCNQKFSNISLLQEHVLEHSVNFKTKAQSQYQCSLCMKNFATAGSLYLHKKTHTGDNPYTCTECNKHFRDKTRLTTHMRVHTGEKPFTCDICLKTFSQKGNLKLHQQKIHLGLKHRKHRCGKCDINFMDKRDLKKHMKKVHDEELPGYDKRILRIASHSTTDTNSKSDDTGETTSTGKTSQTDAGFEKLQRITDDLKKSNVKDLKETLLCEEKRKDAEKITSENKESFDISTPIDASLAENSDSSRSGNSFLVDDELVKADLMTDFKGIFGMGLANVTENLLQTDSDKPAKFVCPICDIPFLTAKAFNEHFLSHDSVAAASKAPPVGYSMIAQSGSEFPLGVKKVYRCEECSLDFVSFPEFQSHLKSHKDNTSKVMCNICQKQMSSSNLLDHMRIHTGEKPYGNMHTGTLRTKEEHDSRTSTETSDKREEQAEAEAAGKRKCNSYCSVPLCKSIGYLILENGHKISYHKFPRDEELKKLWILEIQRDDTSKLRVTQRTTICSLHFKEDDFEKRHWSSRSCVHCGKLFRRSHHLQTHLRTHTGDRPYVCVDCGKTFARGDHLQNHRRTHTGEKPYKCDTCEKSYSQSHHLLRHKRTHTGEKPYSCQMCDKRFSRDHHLKKHMETHRVVIYTGGQKDTNRHTGQHPINNKMKLELPASPMMTRASDRIAQLMSTGWYGNMASELMADMVKRHLLENGTGKETQDSTSTNYGNDLTKASNDLNQSITENTKEKLVEKSLDLENESTELHGSTELHEQVMDQKGKTSEKKKGVNIDDRDQTISFMNQLRAISVASSLEAIVKQRLNEEFDNNNIASEKKMND